MTDVIERIEERPIRVWYKKYKSPDSLHKIVSNAEARGYNLDPKSGLLFRNVYSDRIIESLGYTILDIVFPRPVDFHYHEDVDEALKVLSGEGYLYRKNYAHHDQVYIFPGDEFFIPKRCIHTFRPHNNNGFLEMRLACSGKLDSEKEIQVERFDIAWLQPI